jgi:hypothetical protein
MQSTLDLAARVLASPCAFALRSFGVALGLLVPLAVVLHWYSNRAGEPSERRARTIHTVIPLILLVLACLAQHFADICRTDAVCRQGVDLNCTGANPLIYQSAAIVSAIAAVACGGLEIRRRYRLRARG